MAAEYGTTCRHRRVHQTLPAHLKWRRGPNSRLGRKQPYSLVSCCMAGCCARLRINLQSLVAAAPVLLPYCIAGDSTWVSFWCSYQHAHGATDYR